MALTYKVLGQSGSTGSTGNGSETLTATTLKTLYTVPSLTSAIVSTIVVANQATTAGSYRIGVVPSGGTASNAQHFLVYDATINANTSAALTLGITLAAGDKITIYASASTFSFTAFGSEVTA